jgi:hypothetical protein
MTKQELITKYFNAQSEEEVQKSIELMNEAIRMLRPKTKKT